MNCIKFQEKKFPPALTDRKKTLEENKIGKNDKFAALKAKREDKLQKGFFLFSLFVI